MSSNDNDSNDTSTSSANAGGAKGSKPGGPGEFFNRLLNETHPMRDQLDRNARALAQSALSTLDVVSRKEFDAQSAVLARTRQRVVELETELERLSQIIESNTGDK